MAKILVLSILFGASIYGVASSALTGIGNFSLDSKQVLYFGDY